MSGTRSARVFLLSTGLGAGAAVAMAAVGVPTPIVLNAALLAHVTGLLAGYLAAVMIIVMARVPALEYRIGPDTMTRWHARGGRVFLLLVLVHAGSAVQAWAQTRQQNLVS